MYGMVSLKNVLMKAVILYENKYTLFPLDFYHVDLNRDNDWTQREYFTDIHICLFDITKAKMPLNIRKLKC